MLAAVPAGGFLAWGPGGRSCEGGARSLEVPGHADRRGVNAISDRTERPVLRAAILLSDPNPLMADDEVQLRDAVADALGNKVDELGAERRDRPRAR